MPFDLATAKPVAKPAPGGFDLASARPVATPEEAAPFQQETLPHIVSGKLGIHDVPRPLRNANPDPVGTLAKAPYEAGGMVTDAAANMGLPAPVAAGAGFVTNVGLNALPMAFGGGAAKGAAPVLQKGARTLMQSALKPTIKQLQSGDAGVAIDTLLKEGINPTEGGVKLLKARIGELDDQIAAAIEQSGATISKGEVGKKLIPLFEQFKKQVNATDDLKAIKQAWIDFRNHPLLAGKQDIPVQLAHELKKGTYQTLKKKYGTVGTASDAAQKTLASGLREGVADAVPEIAGLTKQESDLIRTMKVTERRALMELNKNPMGLSLLAHNPATWAAFMADKSALFKSVAARMLNSGAEQIPATAARGGIAAATADASIAPEPPTIKNRKQFDALEPGAQFIDARTGKMSVKGGEQ